MAAFGAIYHLLPRVMGFDLPFPRLARVQFWLCLFGVILWAGSLAAGGVEQGMKLQDPNAAFADSTAVALIFLRAGTTGLLLLLLGSLLFAANIFVMTFKWKMALLQIGHRRRQGADRNRARFRFTAARPGGEIVKSGFRVFLLVFVALGLSWCGFVLGSVKQLGTEKQKTVLNSSDTYPLQRSGDAALGLQVYRANGCAACHTEQIRQTGVACNVVLTGLGKNPLAVTNLVSKLQLTGLTKDAADAVAGQITAAGGKSETQIVATGADIARGWGVRQSVAADYLYDVPVQLGSLRAGPDLSNIGVRDPDLNWQLVHLYAPRSLVKGSAMPPFRYLFELRKKVDGTQSDDALQFPPAFAPPAGYEVVPTTGAKQLAAYLLSLKAAAPLYEAPFTPAISKP